jgi:hypothetical protein
MLILSLIQTHFTQAQLTVGKIVTGLTVLLLVYINLWFVFEINFRYYIHVLFHQFLYGMSCVNRVTIVWIV